MHFAAACNELPANGPQSDVVILRSLLSGDEGPMHLAAACNELPANGPQSDVVILRSLLSGDEGPMYSPTAFQPSAMIQYARVRFAPRPPRQDLSALSAVEKDCLLGVIPNARLARIST